MPNETPRCGNCNTVAVVEACCWECPNAVCPDFGRHFQGVVEAQDTDIPFEEPEGGEMPNEVPPAQITMVSFNCVMCGLERNVEPDFQVPVTPDGGGLCSECSYDHICQDCGEFDERSLRYNLCRTCRRTEIGDGEEEFDTEATMSDARLRIVPIPGRESIRLCGVEIEGGDGSGSGQDLALALHGAGLSRLDGVGSYHAGRHSNTGFAHVENDSSVDWECVIGPVNPARRSDITQLNRVVREIRSMVHDGILTLDLRCGLHIHVGAERVGLDSSYNLSVLFGYVEDVIFRLGAARWPVHRSIQNDHYSQPIPKSLRKLQFAREHSRDNRYYALSFNNYFNSVLNNCQCGATRYDSWEDCTCDLGKCTFEFRLFNTTANPRKLHAYMALCQALVAKAISLGRLTEEQTADDYPPMSFERRRFKDVPSINQEAMVESWQERLRWMFTELPLTDDEKASLAYCVRHSELAATGDEFMESLLNEQPESQEVPA